MKPRGWGRRRRPAGCTDLHAGGARCHQQMQRGRRLAAGGRGAVAVEEGRRTGYQAQSSETRPPLLRRPPRVCRRPPECPLLPLFPPAATATAGCPDAVAVAAARVAGNLLRSGVIRWSGAPSLPPAPPLPLPPAAAAAAAAWVSSMPAGSRARAESATPHHRRCWAAAAVRAAGRSWGQQQQQQWQWQWQRGTAWRCPQQQGWGRGRHWPAGGADCWWRRPARPLRRRHHCCGLRGRAAGGSACSVASRQGSVGPGLRRGKRRPCQ